MRDLTLAIPAGFAKRKTKSSSKILNLSLLAAIIIFSLLYLFAINSLGTKGYEIRKLEQQVREVEEMQKTLQIQASDLQSINRIRESSQKYNFVPSTNIVYLKDSDFALK